MFGRSVLGFLFSFLALVITLAALVADSAKATQPAREKGDVPPHITQRLRDLSRTSRGYLSLTRTVRANRSAAKTRAFAAPPIGGIAITGSRSIPVLMGTFNNTPREPYPVGNLQKELFDGPWPTGTMTEYYRDISYGTFTVTGTVFPWKKVGQTDVYYAGGKTPAGDPCNGLCDSTKIGEFLKDLLDKYGDQIDWTQFDNDGPDGIPNSWDDDGYVDFVAFVHPEIGGECLGNDNIWSHRATYQAWMGSYYETKSIGKNGKKIRINDYVIMPALACDRTTMIQIGVFAHEFGHAFGLPDLYDTQRSNGSSAGIGNWGLMGAGSWGGDNKSPERPSHMSAWEKDIMGWVTPVEVKVDTDVSLRPVERFPDVYKVRISEDEYYLLEYRRKTGFDQSLTGSGLLIWRVNDPVISAGLANNTVNADETRKGLGLIEADGKTELDDEVNRGDAGDMFPTMGKRNFDNSTVPASVGTVAVCNITDPDATIQFKIVVSRGTCN